MTWVRGFLLVLGSVMCACTVHGAAGSADSGQDGAAPAALTYHRDIAPILAKHCVSCHLSGGIAPFALTNYDDVAFVAERIKQKTASREMPPWLADNTGSCQNFRNATWLTQAELDAIAAWVDGGRLKGDPADEILVPIQTEQLDEVSATLDVGQPYTPNVEKTDDYRCFLVDPKLQTDGYLTAYRANPGDARVVHHIIVYSLETQAAEQNAMMLDGLDETPGYDCFGGIGANDLAAFRFIAGFVPGVSVTRYPEGTGILLRKARKLVMQVHYNLANGSYPDRSTIDLQIASSVREKAQILPLAEPETLMLPPGQSGARQVIRTKIADRLPIAVSTAITLWGIAPHMHTLGTRAHVSIEDAESTTCLVDVPRWNFNWQRAYFYDAPIQINTAQTVTLECTYDTTYRSTPTRWGEESSQEMCLSYFYVTGVPSLGL